MVCVHYVQAFSLIVGMLREEHSQVKCCVKHHCTDQGKNATGINDHNGTRRFSCRIEHMFVGLNKADVAALRVQGLFEQEPRPKSFWRGGWLLTAVGQHGNTKSILAALAGEHGLCSTKHICSDTQSAVGAAMRLAT